MALVLDKAHGPDCGHPEQAIAQPWPRKVAGARLLAADEAEEGRGYECDEEDEKGTGSKMNEEPEYQRGLMERTGGGRSYWSISSR
jgi:hypothetical protein